MNVKATVVATTTLVVTVDGVAGTLVCIRENDAMTVAPQGRRQLLLARGPPAFPAADDDHGVGLQDLANSFREIPAKIDFDAGLHRLFTRHGEELLLRELHRHLRRFECQRVRNYLGDVNRNATAQVASQSAGNI